MSIKITVFKIKSHFTEYSSVISSLSIILTKTVYFLKFSNKCKFYKNKKILAYFQHAFYIQLNVDAYFIVLLNCFWLNKRTTKLLAHLSRRLTRWAYRMGLEPASVRPCVRASVRPHFQTWISQRPAGRLQPNFIWSIIGVGERLH